jgi:hypothetical protein
LLTAAFYISSQVWRSEFHHWFSAALNAGLLLMRPDHSPGDSLCVSSEPEAGVVDPGILIAPPRLEGVSELLEVFLRLRGRVRRTSLPGTCRVLLEADALETAGLASATSLS